MIFYILSNQITDLFLSLNLLTTLTFDSEITGFYHGFSDKELFTKLANNQRTLVLQAKREGISSNLLVVTRGGKFLFHYSVDEKNPHEFVEIKQGAINHGMKFLKSYPSFDLWEGSTSYMILNKEKNEIEINGIKVKGREFFSKGTPLIMNGVRLTH